MSFNRKLDPGIVEDNIDGPWVWSALYRNPKIRAIAEQSTPSRQYPKLQRRLKKLLKESEKYQERRQQLEEEIKKLDEDFINLVSGNR